MFTTEPSERLQAMLIETMQTETMQTTIVLDVDPEPWKFTTDLTRALPVVTAVGFLDISNKDQMRQELLSAAAYSTVIVVDMADTFCDASGMNVLEEIGGLLAHHGGELRLTTTRRLTLHFLNAFGLNRRMRIFPTLSEALSGTRQNRKPQPEFLAA